MDTLTETLATVNEAVAKTVNAVQAQLLALHRDAAAAVAKASESLPSLEPSAPVDLDAFVKSAFEFQAQRLEADKQFALDLIDVWTPKPAGRTRSSK